MKKTKMAVPAALLSMICVQGGASIAKRMFPVVGAVATSALRIGISAIILTLINRPKLSQFTRKQWLYCFLYGLGIAAMNLIFYMAIQRIPLGLGVTIEFVGPLFLALALSRKWLDVLWAMLACLGILLIVPWQNDHLDLLGLFLAFLAGAFWALYIIIGGKISKVMKGRDAVTTGMLVAAAIIFPFALWDGAIFHVTPIILLQGLGIAILSSALPFTLDFVALKNIPAKTFSVLTSLHPAFAAFSGLIFLQEQLTPLQWTSIACVVLASMGTTLFSRNEAG
ncbi:EamA family transporter [Sphingobacterium psychroaquaticum]|nr:EamA family transporter [Sphingobacterium psychroaquaticum]QBQ41430.1 EamA family transporter [Sphingobacterium psychroaquaticum]